VPNPGRNRSNVRIGTRGSQLALYQARTVASLLERHAGVAAEIVVIRTSGDRLAEAPLSEIGGKRLFVKEIEDALLAGDVDLAVHSSKDMPAVLPEGLRIAAVLPREDPRDALVLPGAGGQPRPWEEIVAEMGPAPRIGTSSVRRAAQLTTVWPAARFAPVRGNLDTRLRKLDEGQFDAMILAAAGLTRLERADRISAMLPVEICVPAPGQGIIAVEARSDDDAALGRAARIDVADVAAALSAERTVVVRLGGGCQMPIGACEAVTGDTMSLVAIVTSLDGSRAARAHGTGRASDPEALGATVADQLMAAGAGGILAEVRRAQGSVEGIQP
jgi:hydroxymethylbilane synthase